MIKTRRARMHSIWRWLPTSSLHRGARCVPLVMLVLMFIAWMPATSATAQDGLDPTGSNVRIWGEIGFNGKIGPDDEVVQVAGGWRHTVAVLADGSVACWGYNAFGQCNVPSGIGTPENPVASVAAGKYHTVAVLADGSVACWGYNTSGQCDVPSGIGTSGNPVASVAAGGSHTVAVLSDGAVACWGSNS
ncbi:MAG: hypothetical protein GY871_06555, partial [Actinomycetales bacterium]|nr:hypothetical protein [Actinomycetales bacterium]